MREFGKILNTYQNRSSSKPWAIAQGFWSKSVDFGPLGIYPKSVPTSSKTVRIRFKACRRRLSDFGTILNSYQNPSSSKPWTIAQAFWSKSVDFGPLGIYPKSVPTSSKTVRIRFKACRRRLSEFGTILNSYQNPSSSKPWTIAQAFWSKSVDFGPLGIYPKFLPTSSKTVRNQFPSILVTFERVWDDLWHLPKSVLFKTMGYSPGFLVKIGRFQAHGNLPEICSNKLQSS